MLAQAQVTPGERCRQTGLREFHQNIAVQITTLLIQYPVYTEYIDKEVLPWRRGRSGPHEIHPSHVQSQGSTAGSTAHWPVCMRNLGDHSMLAKSSRHIAMIQMHAHYAHGLYSQMKPRQLQRISCAPNARLSICALSYSGFSAILRLPTVQYMWYSDTTWRCCLKVAICCIC